MSRIYIADLACYNAGRLVGRHVEMTDDADDNLEAIEAAIEEMKEERPDSESFIVHDYDDGISLGETSDWRKLATFGALFEEHGEAFRACVDSFGAHYVSSDFDEASEFFSDHHRGHYTSVADYAEEMSDDSEVPERFRQYINYGSMAHDWTCNGDITAVEVGDGVHIFTNH
jgi:antirestriction protein